MSYDALVWLLVGLGVGVAGSLMLFLGYSMLEYGRLSRRFRKARLAATAAAVPAVEPVPVAPKTSLLARPTPKPAAGVKPVVDARPANEVKPAETKPVDGSPARPALAVVPAPEPKPVAVAALAPVAAVVETKPIAVPAPEPVKPPEPRPPQSVEAMFAEAFANDRLTVSPEPDEAAGAKPGAEKPPA